MRYFSPGLLDGSVTTAKLADRAVTSGKLFTFVGSFAGSIFSNTGLDFSLDPDAFFPMISVSSQVNIHMTGHTTDGGSADNPRFGFWNASGITQTYDIDFRSIDP